MLFLTNKIRNCIHYKLFLLRFLFTGRFFPFLLMLFICNYAIAQQPPANADTVRIIQIVQGKSLRQKTIDSGFVIETIAGDVVLKEGLTIFNCDSAIINHHTNIMEAFGNIHINQNDSIHTYAQHLRYFATDRLAWLDKDVKLTDKKGILYTQALKYDLKTNRKPFNKVSQSFQFTFENSVGVNSFYLNLINCDFVINFFTYTETKPYLEKAIRLMAIIAER